MDLQAILLPLFLLWAIALVLVLLRYDTSSVWRLSVLLVFLFYLAWFWQDLTKGWERYVVHFTTEFPRLFKNLIGFVPLLLLFLWPAVLLAAYNKDNRSRSERLLRNMALVTLFYWLFWISTEYLNLVPHTWSAKTIIKTLRSIEIPSPP